jgi:RNA polymerase sigma-70 factor, ECF subfamily
MSNVAKRADLRLVESAGEEAPDGALVRRYLAGERDAARVLYERTARMVHGLVFRLMGHDNELRDIVQDIYVTAFSRLADLDSPQAFAAWIRSITVHTVHKRLAHRSRRRRFGFMRRPEIDPDLLVSASAPPDVALEVKTIYRKLESLPAEERVTLVLRRIEGLSIEEVATLTETSPSTVKRRLAAAMISLGLHGGSDA